VRRGAGDVHPTSPRLKRPNDQRPFAVPMHAEKREWIAVPARNNPKDTIVRFPSGHAHSALLVDEAAVPSVRTRKQK
jgi:hypothetical protein